METSYYQLRINETGRTNPRDFEDCYRIGDIAEKFTTAEELREYLIERYGRVPRGRRRVYVDRGGRSVVVGFIHSFWNREYCRYNEKAWFQTDWISITRCSEVYVDVVDITGEP